MHFNTKPKLLNHSTSLFHNILNDIPSLSLRFRGFRGSIPLPTETRLSSSFKDDIYMFGGKLEANGGNVTDELWVFNIPGRTWQRKIPVVGPPGQTQIYAVEGHSAHCILLEGGEAIMLVIFGYSPIYSYISNVQEYNLSKSRLRSSAS